MLTTKVRGVENIRKQIVRQLGVKLYQVATNVYFQAGLETYKWTTFLASNWRVSTGRRNEYVYGSVVQVGPLQWEPLSVDDSNKNFFNLNSYNLENIYISNSAPYSELYNEGTFKPYHAGIVTSIRRYALARLR